MKKLKFSKAFKYPFNRWKGLLNIFWILLPIFGWFAVMGFQVRLVREWVSGKFKKLPLFSFKDDMKLGFMIFIKLLPLMLLVMLFGWIFGRAGPLGELVFVLAVLLAVPVLAINVMVKGTVDAGFEFEQVKKVIDNLGDYVYAFVMDLGLSIVFWILSIILIGIPAATFTKNMFLSDFYRRNIK